MVTVDAPVVEARPVLHSGLRRNLKIDMYFRDVIAKFDNRGNLSDIELRHLLEFYGILIRMTEIIGESYYLPHQDVLNRHERLREIATARGWTPALMSMCGVLVEGIFDKIC